MLVCVCVTQPDILYLQLILGAWGCSHNITYPHKSVDTVAFMLAADDRVTGMSGHNCPPPVPRLFCLLRVGKKQRSGVYLVA